jgi:micrococcal nuclease
MDMDFSSWIPRILGIVVLLVGFGWVILFLVRQAPAPLQKHEAIDRDPGPKIGDDAPIPGQPVRLRSRLYYYAAHVTSVYDGDTLTVDVDLGLGVWRHNQTIRLWKVNTPEMKGAEREQGTKVRDFVRAQVLDKPILLRTILDKRGEDQTGKFGRLLGEILVEDESGQVINLNQLLLDRGMAQPMDEQGSKVTAAARSLSAPPNFVPCPFCGQTRAVDQETAVMQLCPNCLDPARPVF